MTHLYTFALYMPSPFEYLKELVEFAKLNKLTHVKCGDVEFTLAVESLGEAVVSPPSVKDLDTMPSDDDLIMWSAGGLLPSDARRIAQEERFVNE